MITKEKIYEYFNLLGNNESIPETAENILKSIETQFESFDIIFKDIFVNDLTENFNFFSSLENSFKLFCLNNIASVFSSSSSLFSLETSFKLFSLTNRLAVYSSSYSFYSLAVVSITLSS